MTLQRPIHLHGYPDDPPGFTMTPWVRRWRERLADVRVPEGITVVLSARSARGPFVANIHLPERHVMVWHSLPEQAARLALAEAGYPSEAPVTRVTTVGGYVTEIE